MRLKYLPALLFLSACTRRGRFLDSFEDMTLRIIDLLQKPSILFLVILVVYWSFFYLVIAYALSKSGIFADGGKLDKNGKMLAGVISAIATAGMLFAARDVGTQAFLIDFFEGPVAIFFGLIILVFAFMVMFNFLKGDKK